MRVPSEHSFIDDINLYRLEGTDTVTLTVHDTSLHQFRITGGKKNICKHISGVAEDVRRIETLELASAPNPFSVNTTLIYSLPEESDVHLEIFDMLGRVVMTMNEPSASRGTHRYEWRAGTLPNGTYIARLEAAGHTHLCKLLRAR